MAQIVIRVINSRGFIGRAINWITNSLWDHAEIMTPEGNWIGAHSSGGVQERSPNYVIPTREGRYAIPCTDRQLALIMSYARNRIGEKYNFTDIVGLLLRKRNLNSPHKTICSQFVINCLWRAGIFLLNVDPAYDYLVTPEMVHLSPLLIGRRIAPLPEPEK